MSSKWQKRDDGFDLRIEGYHLVLTRSGQGWWWTIFTDRGGEYGEGYASTLEKAKQDCLRTITRLGECLIKRAKEAE